MNHTTHIRLVRHIGQIALAVTLVCLGTAAMAVPNAQFQSALQQFMQGDSAAVDGAADAFSSLLKSEPANAVLMAYTGAATARKATTTILPWKKMTYAEDGLALLDKALAMLSTSHNAPVQRGTPGVLEVKFVAANTFLAVPGFMNRHERGTKLLGDVINSPLFATAPLPFKGTVWLKAAVEATKANNTAEAKRYLGLIVSQQAPQSAKAQTLLKGMAS